MIPVTKPVLAHYIPSLFSYCSVETQAAIQHIEEEEEEQDIKPGILKMEDVCVIQWLFESLILSPSSL